VAVGNGGEEVTESSGEIVGGGGVAGEVVGNVFAGLLCGAGLGFLTGVVGAEVLMAGGTRSVAMAAVDVSEGTQRVRRSMEKLADMGIPPEGESWVVFWECSRETRRGSVQS